MEHSEEAPKYQLGRLVATAGIHSAFGSEPAAWDWLLQCLIRHATGDWGDVPASDAALNNGSASDEAIDLGDRVQSSYEVPGYLRDDSHPNDRVWFITANEPWDATSTVRATTVLWPSEY